MSEIKLKPCPFCGGIASLRTVDITGHYFVDCDVTKGFCEVMPSTWEYETKEEAIEAWNRRDGAE